MAGSLRTAIFGATSAIAAEVAAVCAARGDRLWLVGRDAAKLAALRERLGDAVVGAEVCDFEQIDACAPCVQRAIDGLGAIDLALLAHGYLGDQLRSEHDVGYARHVIDVNFTSAVALLLPLAAHFEAQGRGHLAAITSVAGVRGRPRNYTYGAAKSALGTYLQGVRSRLYRRGVKVHDVRLGPVPTPMSEGHPQNFLWGEKGEVARGIVRAMARRWHVVYLPRRWALVMAIVRVMPEWLFQRFGFLAGR